MSDERIISHAYWESAREGLIVLSRDWDRPEEKPPLFLSPPKRPFHSLEQAPPLVFARMSGYLDYRGKTLFALYLDDHPRDKLREHGVFVAGPFNDWDPLSDPKRWRLHRNKLSGESYATLRIPEKLLKKGEPFPFKFVTGSNHWLDVSRSAPNAVVTDGYCNFEFNPVRTGRHLFFFSVPEDFPLLGNEEILWSDDRGEETHHLPPTSSFLEIHSPAELGAIPGNGETRFRLFAPRAIRVLAVWYRNLDESDRSELPLEFAQDGVWEGRVGEDLRGAYYYWIVDGENRDGTTDFSSEMKILDPYAKATVGREGPGIILGEDHFPKTGVPDGFEPPRWDDLIVCECHIRDALARCPFPLEEQDRLGYRGLAKWIRSGRSYFHELGVNGVELQPIQEFDSKERAEYHWGYMPVNYFSPESTYGSDPEKGSQVEEFRDLVRAFHEEGFTVILDVVYNHIGQSNNLLFIDKYYYLKLDAHHQLENWSGCGNDLRTDAPMVRRLIIDSLAHWIKQYGVDGFRFDLADLIGKETLLEIESELKGEYPHLVLIAEPWSFRGHIAEALKDTAYASWNDGFRDFIKDYVRGENNRDAATYFLAGSPGNRTTWPAQTVNFSESHDDFCWLDRITENDGHEARNPSPADRRRTHLMAAFLFASLGIPMLSAGQDGLRTKQGVENTYQRGDLNAIDYERRTYYSGTAQYFALWTRLRLSPLGRLFRPGAHIEGYLAMKHPDESSAIACLYNANGTLGEERLLFAINPHIDPTHIPWPADAGTWRWIQIADHERIALHGLEGNLLPTDNYGMRLPALSCGLWKNA